MNKALQECLDSLFPEGVAICKETSRMGKLVIVAGENDHAPFVAKFFPFEKGGALSKDCYHCPVYEDSGSYDNIYDWIKGYKEYFVPLYKQENGDENDRNT